MPKLSLIVSTLGRSEDVVPFLESLERQTDQDFEVIFVDQNADDRLLSVLSRRTWPFPVTRLSRPDVRGLSSGRNVGCEAATGEILLFPDDDCWYPPWMLAKGRQIMRERGVDIVAGRAADEGGRSINGRYAKRATPISPANVFDTQIEWVVFFRREVVEAIRGFDAGIGTGASTPWQACEGADIVLRALSKGFTAFFDPDLFGHHRELKIDVPDAGMRRKARGYARGMGYVMHKHGYGPAFAGYRICRPLAPLLLNAVRLRKQHVLYHLNVVAGRIEGYLNRTI